MLFVVAALNSSGMTRVMRCTGASELQRAELPPLQRHISTCIATVCTDVLRRARWLVLPPAQPVVLVFTTEAMLYVLLQCLGTTEAKKSGRFAMQQLQLVTGCLQTAAAHSV